MIPNAPRPGLARLALLLLLAGGSASAGETVVSRVRDACGPEIDSLCSNITRGDGRVIACLYANQDQISHRCDYVLFDAAAELQEIMRLMSRVSQVCKPDLEHLCANVAGGEGRMMQCLRKNQMALSSPCHDAIEKIGIDVN